MRPMTCRRSRRATSIALATRPAEERSGGEPARRQPVGRELTEQVARTVEQRQEEVLNESRGHLGLARE